MAAIVAWSRVATAQRSKRHSRRYLYILMINYANSQRVCVYVYVCVQAMEAERAVSAELQTLRQDVRECGHSRPQDEELLSAMREQVRHTHTHTYTHTYTYTNTTTPAHHTHTHTHTHVYLQSNKYNNG